MIAIPAKSPPFPSVGQLAGLTASEAKLRLSRDGFNELPSSEPRSIFQMAFDVIREPMLLLLLACGATYWLLGDAQEAIILLGFVLVVISITLYQERKTERAIEALRDLSSPRALVIRDGERIRIAGREVVPGDVLVLSEGDRIAADAMLLTAVNLSTDESLLTGESVPVRKQSATADGDMPIPGGEDLPYVFSGTLVVRGTGLALAKRTGVKTELGKIGKSITEVHQEPTLLERDTKHVVWMLASVGLGLCAVLVLVYGFTRGDWLNGFLAALTLAMAILPEELPVVLTIFLALGAWRMSQHRVLARHMPAIETLGAATTLCVDKTGTLTRNKMTVAQLWRNGEGIKIADPPPATIPERFQPLLEFAMLASQPEPFDPMDRAIRELGDQVLHGSDHLHSDWKMVREYALSSELLTISQVWSATGAALATVAVKGAPEAVAGLCHLPPERIATIHKSVAAFASEGLRVLGVAQAQAPAAKLPEAQQDFEFSFLGLLALADPVRPNVPDAIAQCQSAGINVIMITGDYPGTALSIARQIGLDLKQGAITGSEVTAMDESELRARVRTSSVFARAVPQQKLQLVNALKANGEIVAMTGDGVNDAPALKAANIGIAMGQRGTDVARESSDLVLLDDDFASIVHSVRLGRRIFDNLKKAMEYTFAIHIPIAGLALCSAIFRWPMILEPVHVAFLELIIDPVCSIAFEAEPEEPGIMERKPRPALKSLFDRAMVLGSILQGSGILAILLVIYAVALRRGQGEQDARALTFASLVLANLALIVGNRSWARTAWETLRTPNPAMWWVATSAVSFLALVLYVPYLRRLFHFSTLHPNDILLCLAAGALSLGWLELLKMISRRHKPTPQAVA